MTMPAQTPEPAPAASARRLFGARYGEGLAVLLPGGGRNRREIVRHEGRCAEGTSGG
ncbi:hypothetical protein ABZ203_25770 [Streptomyces albidoflavus]|uniref:hypothetical protein n=1 Tax=Streptomyces TaxID=1883 RepID=UPI001C2EB434|nr:MULTISPECIES: hypothetical protein [unclassified Streptomyces]MBV1955389.1 hypothetical protein [Streptomyces sp. BV333]MCG5121684.1 hypothetical protein [Streptomyces sp. T7(2022)]MCQ9709890.1 hypothetical protein [Streptomyces sp. BSP1]WTC01343.1 hypothetical protein OG794_05640 [Streptomyces albidoflavus]